MIDWQPIHRLACYIKMLFPETLCKEFNSGAFGSAFCVSGPDKFWRVHSILLSLRFGFDADCAGWTILFILLSTTLTSGKS